jgi:hypothetical protein
LTLAQVQGGAAPVPVAVAPAAAAAAESALNPVIPVPGVDGVILVTGRAQMKPASQVAALDSECHVLTSPKPQLVL